jgi:hypothetical protein
MACDQFLLGVVMGISYKDHRIPVFSVSVSNSVSITLIRLKSKVSPYLMVDMASEFVHSCETAAEYATGRYYGGDM